ncbi:Gfo/Idh/MocA family protein [Flavihumibacter profundi]|uniref:Gfo/Idh/MocA family protein n=1 Tax=Flavihumibacter profundi TaxID=2716883 RepID=UPI001CC3BCE0|nr:Gfo/Idh/MocA family oxidoreductase [Flavihumibacter profundi]MBZ5856860.1 Gfo/Idh/MocA family oxidoreductase [Flavihumibacter profundi]
MPNAINRRKFLRNASLASAGFGLLGVKKSQASEAATIAKTATIPAGGRIGIIGLDTSHSISFVDALNGLNPSKDLAGYKIVAAYPYGSRDIKSSAERIPSYTEYVKRFDVEIVDSISALLSKVDVVMLETNDGRPHLEQALEVLKTGKKLFVDKPVAGSLEDVLAVYEAARFYKVPIFSASSLRYNTGVQETASGKTIGKVLGADAFSPSPLEPTHPDFFWYGIHGIETLCTLMGKGCKQVSRINAEQTDIVVGVWNDGRLGSFRGTRNGANEYGATAFGETGVQRIGPYSGYDALLKQVIRFFQTGIPPVTEEETIEIYGFMEAAHESKRQGGATVQIAAVLEKARKNMKKKW